MSSRFIDFLLGYEKSEKSFKDSRIAKADKKFTDTLIGGGSNSAAFLIKNPISRFIGKMTHSIAYASTKAYGTLFLVFGVLTLLINFANYYFGNPESGPAFALTVGVIFAAVAIPLLLVDIPFADVFQKWSFTNILIFGVLCIKHVGSGEKRASESLIVPVLIGAAIATAGFFFSMQLVLLILLASIFVLLALSSPEFSYMITLLVLPILPLFPHSGTALAILLVLTAVSFIAKVILGKRIYHFEQYDCVIIFFMLFVLVSGIFNNGLESFENSLVTLALTLMYFLTSNIIVNRRLADNAINIVIFSSVPTAVYAIIYYFLAPAHPEWLDPMFQDTIVSRAEGTFGNPNIYSVFLLAAIVFSVGFAFAESRKKFRGFYIAALILNTAAMVLTWTRGAWLALILGGVAFLIIKSIKAPKLLLIPLIVLPLLLVFIPESVSERFLSIFNTADSSIASRLSVWRSAIEMFTENIFIGVGVGESAFRDEFAKYAEDSVTAPHSHNLFLEIGCEMGIFALALFLILLLIRIRHRASYTLYVRGSSVTSICSISGVAVFILLCFGMTDYIWYSSAMYVLFWFVFGLGSAALRIARKEYDEAIDAADYGSTSESATANITILG